MVVYEEENTIVEWCLKQLLTSGVQAQLKGLVLASLFSNFAVAKFKYFHLSISSMIFRLPYNEISHFQNFIAELFVSREKYLGCQTVGPMLQ